jgi:hypothetical protein
MNHERFSEKNISTKTVLSAGLLALTLMGPANDKPQVPQTPSTHLEVSPDSNDNGVDLPIDTNPFDGKFQYTIHDDVGKYGTGVPSDPQAK